MGVKLNLRFAFELSTIDGSPLNPDLVVNAQNNGSKYFQGHINLNPKERSVLLMMKYRLQKRKSC